MNEMNEMTEILLALSRRKIEKAVTVASQRLDCGRVTGAKSYQDEAETYLAATALPGWTPADTHAMREMAAVFVAAELASERLARG